MLKPEFKSLYLQSSLFFSLWSSTFGFPWITVHLNAHSEDNYYWLLTKLILIEDIGAGSVFAEVQVAQFVLQNWNKPWVKKKVLFKVFWKQKNASHIQKYHKVSGVCTGAFKSGSQRVKENVHQNVHFVLGDYEIWMGILNLIIQCWIHFRHLCRREDYDHFIVHHMANTTYQCVIPNALLKHARSLLIYVTV